MKCGGCVRSVEQILLEQPSVAHASVNLVTRTAWLDLKDSDQSIESILAALKARGFSARPRHTTPLEQPTASRRDALGLWWHQWRQLMVALVLLLLSVFSLFVSTIYSGRRRVFCRHHVFLMLLLCFRQLYLQQLLDFLNNIHQAWYLKLFQSQNLPQL